MPTGRENRRSSDSCNSTFLNAKTVGDLTGVFLAQLDEQLGKKGFRFALPTIRRKPRRLGGFVLDRGRISIPKDDFFRADPVRLLELFALAAREQLEIHPTAMRAATRDAPLIDRGVRVDAARQRAVPASADLRFIDPETVLRWMNEAGVFGRFVPDFGRVVAQMQFDMYHHYTVDEHSIRAIGLLAAIERGELKSDHPLSTAILNKQIASRRVLYVAVLLHDIAKGRGGDHSVIGAEIALKLCPRFGLDAAETETVSWLVRYHLLMSSTAFKRDLADPKTIEDFAHQVQSPERLRLLLILTVVDIRAVGPGVWNEWKRMLLRTLFEAAEERLRLGHKQHGRAETVEERQKALGQALGWKASAVRAHARRLPDSYWLAEPPAWQVANARQVAAAEAHFGDATPDVVVEDDSESGATRVSVFTPDREALFYRICAGLAAAGANIVDARIHTTRDGMALDNLLVLDGRGRAYGDRRLRSRLAKSVEAALSSPAPPSLPGADASTPQLRLRSGALGRYRRSGIDPNDRGRGQRPRPSRAARRARWRDPRSGHTIHSAHIATYGERAVDVFYLTRADGRKLTTEDAEALRSALLQAAREAPEAKAA